jgi:hypothetical protein
MCTETHFTMNGQKVEGPSPLVPVLQVYEADAPGIPFPEGRDLLQVLWCPFLLHHGFPEPRVHWRDSRSVESVQVAPRPLTEATKDYIPKPCVIHPEVVTEYPAWDMPEDLRASLRGRMEQVKQETGWKYHYHLADAPGIKLGGFPSWTQEPAWPDCESCGQRMEHLLTVASVEYDGESWRSWMPVEDRPKKGASPFEPGRSRAAQTAAGLTLGDNGGVYVFECRTCPERPFAHWGDCP